MARPILHEKPVGIRQKVRHHLGRVRGSISAFARKLSGGASRIEPEKQDKKTTSTKEIRGFMPPRKKAA
ncbi:MAG: hypothetical protein NUV57_00610 [archaeon]|nr:hypothetical protein [archaeon]